jgi:hypothetical protein
MIIPADRLLHDDELPTGVGRGTKPKAYRHK